MERLINQLAMSEGLLHISIFNSTAMEVDKTSLMVHKSQSNQHRSLMNLTLYKYILKRATEHSNSTTILRQCKDETIGTPETKLRTYD